jgi:hypothetical protein
LIIVPKEKETTMPPADDNAEKETQERDEALRRAVKAKMDKFMAENPQLMERFKAMTKEELIQDIILSEMKIERSQALARGTEVLKQWMIENPDIVAKVRERVKNRAANPRERELIARAMTERENQGIRASSGIRP